jgi:uncharacterized protein (TIGR00730 family)
MVSLDNLTIVSVFGSSGAQPDDADYLAAVAVGRELSASGYAVATGGYGGIMEAACRGAAEAGGKTIGVTAPSVFPGRVGANQWVQQEIAADNLIERIGIMMEISAGFIAMPGSIGTLAELVVAWNLAFVAPYAGSEFGPVVAVGDTWNEVVPSLVSRLGTKDLVTVVPSGSAAVASIIAQLSG